MLFPAVPDPVPGNISHGLSIIDLAVLYFENMCSRKVKRSPPVLPFGNSGHTCDLHYFRLSIVLYNRFIIGICDLQHFLPWDPRLLYRLYQVSTYLRHVRIQVLITRMDHQVIYFGDLPVHNLQPCSQDSGPANPIARIRILIACAFFMVCL